MWHCIPCCWRLGAGGADADDAYCGSPKRPSCSDKLMSVLFGKDAEPKAVCHQTAVHEYVQATSAQCVLDARLRELVLLRGPPGLGKSTLALQELRCLRAPGASQGVGACGPDQELVMRLVHVCSTDDFFTQISETRAEKYVFNPKKLGHHHQRNQERVHLLMDLGITPLYVDNTNTTWWEMASYVRLADAAGYSVRIVEPRQLSAEWDSVEFLSARNRTRRALGKDLDATVLRRMITRFEPLPPEKPELWASLVRAASRTQPAHVGIDVHQAFLPEAEAEAEGEAGMDAKALANRRKKDKKKAKKGATGGEGFWGAADADAKAEEAAGPSAVPDGAASSKAPAEPAEVKPEPKKGGKKESATVRAARERMEQQKKLDEERRAFEEEQRRLIAEEEARIREEEEKAEEERRRKREAKLAKVQRQKEEGTYQTKKEKERARRAAVLREQFGFGADEEEAPEDGEAEAPAKPGKRPVYEKKKKKRVVVEAEGQEPEAGTAEGEVPPPTTKEAEERPVGAEASKSEAPEAAQQEEEDDENNWEKLEETLEQKEEVTTKEDENSEEEEEGSSSSESDSSSSSSELGFRSPIIVIMGHVDTGKTKLLDKIRRTNVQEGEAGGITQQIGATFFPDIALQEQTKKVDPDFDLEVPGIMIIDTPGHESFNNLRARGSSLCDMAILVIDIMHGLELQTVESLEMLKKRRCPFIIALNKIDVCYQWNSKSYTGIRDALDRQEQFVRDEFQKRLGNIMLQLNERGLNVALYWENDDPRSCVSIVPTSALTGEGVPDLLYQLLNLTQTLMADKLEVQEELQCTVIEVKNIEGLGTTIDVVLVNGTLREGDQIVLAGMSGPIVTTIRALLTPQPMKEMRVKNEYIHHTKISTSMGVKICAPGLDEAVAGTELVVVGPDDDIEELKEEVDSGFESILSEFQKQPEGVYVKASTLGSLEALLSFLQDMKIPVFDVGIGEVHKKDVKKAAIMKEKKKPEYSVILCFDVKVNNEAKLQAAHDDVQIFQADIIYHLFDKFKTYMEKILESKKTETRQQAVFPVILQIDKQYVFHKNDPFVFGCSVVGGQLRTGTPICVPEKENLVIGHVGGIEKDHKPVQVARRGDTVCVKIEQNTAQTHITYGRHFDHTNQLFSHITRDSIDTLKEHFKDEMQKSDWEMIIAMKKVFQIQ
mmetsp:Transcript_38040/g.117369  ORF Transcript_38040/g.117369 Transcript_38040/m.117369 type:complete len:1173 (+) Transcript_38040:54-3572(+)